MTLQAVVATPEVLNNTPYRLEYASSILSVVSFPFLVHIT